MGIAALQQGLVSDFTDLELRITLEARQQACVSWLSQFREPSERCEPGRTAREMAALKSAAFSIPSGCFSQLFHSLEMIGAS